jgi:hypothetical protein
MYEKYRGKAAFYVVYIGEAHPADAWQLPSNLKDKVVFESPKDLGERASLAEVCVTKLGIKLPAIVDRFDDAVEQAYTGWPDRLYLIGKDGRILYKSRPGPFGFKPADLDAAIAQTLAAPVSADRRE